MGRRLLGFSNSKVEYDGGYGPRRRFTAAGWFKAGNTRPARYELPNIRTVDPIATRHSAQEQRRLRLVQIKDELADMKRRQARHWKG